MFGGHSIDRFDKITKNFYCLMRFFSGGSSGSASSRLLKFVSKQDFFMVLVVRFFSWCTDQVGLVLVKTIVSVDRLDGKQNLY